VLTALDGSERRLFADRIRALDRRIMPGVTKLTWLSDKHALEYFVKEARRHCALGDACVTGFKAGLARIDALCRVIAEGLLIDVERKKLYDIGEFEAVQGRHHAKVGALVAAVAAALCGGRATAGGRSRSMHRCGVGFRRPSSSWWRRSRRFNTRWLKCTPFSRQTARRCSASGSSSQPRWTRRSRACCTTL
jgi:hypothetical protein